MTTHFEVGALEVQRPFLDAEIAGPVENRLFHAVRLLGIAYCLTALKAPASQGHGQRSHRGLPTPLLAGMDGGVQTSG